MGGCDEWTGAKTPPGYGVRRHPETGRVAYAHRIAYEEANGPIPDGLVIDHLCLNKSCVNPAHMEIVTVAENTRRGPRGKFTADQVREIRASEEPGPVLAERFGTSAGYIGKLRRGARWADLEQSHA